MAFPKGEKHWRWHGGKRHQKGYMTILFPSHPDACPTGYVYEHRLIGEKVLGKPLPKNVEVHHINNIRDDNTKGNLIICSNSYHKILHRREKALRDCGHAHWRKCVFCQKYDDPINLYIHYPVVIHRKCNTLKSQNLRDRRKENARIRSCEI